MLEPAPPSAQRPVAVYVHIPFCAHHCAYCDFNTYVEPRANPLIDQTVDAICADICRTAAEICAAEPQRPPCAPTVFFGGGTPTFLTAEQLARILAAVRTRLGVAAGAEITSEANPESCELERLRGMRDAGFNRLSIGVQALSDDLLRALDRTHGAAEADRAVQSARQAGFENVSIDLMFRLPGQTATLWETTLGRALALEPEHISIYALTLEPGTRFERLRAGGKLDLPDEECELAMYERCIARLAAAGYEQYEVSNFARPGFRSRHNQVYWRNEDYLGFGPGAVSYIAGRRWKRERLPRRYVARVHAGEDLTVEEESLRPDAALGETIMLGLRLRDGIDLPRIEARFSVDVRARYAAQIASLAKQGLLECDDATLRLTHRGLLVADMVAAEFLA